MYNLFKFCSLSFAAILVVVGCSDFSNINTEDTRFPNLTPHVLGPVIKAKITIQDLAELNEQQPSLTFDFDDVDKDDNTPYAKNITSPVAEGQINTFKPIYVRALNINDDLNSFKFSGSFNITISNNFPIDLAEGSLVQFFSAEIGGEEYFKLELDQDIPANGGSATFEVDITNQEINSNIHVFVTEFRTNREDDITFTDEHSITISSDVNFDLIEFIDIKPNREFQVQDTAEVDIDFEDITSDVERDIFDGKAVLYFENNLPADMVFELNLFAADTQTVVDDIIPNDSVTLTGVLTSSDGTPSAKAIVQPVEILLNESRIRRIETAKIIATQLKLRTGNNPNNVANQLSSLEVQIVADGEVNININE